MHPSNIPKRTFRYILGSPLPSERPASAFSDQAPPIDQNTKKPPKKLLSGGKRYALRTSLSSARCSASLSSASQPTHASKNPRVESPGGSVTSESRTILLFVLPLLPRIQPSTLFYPATSVPQSTLYCLSVFLSTPFCSGFLLALLPVSTPSCLPLS